jgi:hypothetical protein
MRPGVGGALLAALTLLIGACTAQVEGTPVKASGRLVPGAVDISMLDIGHYPTAPRPPLGVAGDRMLGLLIEAQRMANNVIGPWEADPSLTTHFGAGGMALVSAETVGLIGPAEFGASVGQHNFINGFTSARTAEGLKILQNTVLRFGDPPSAAAAAVDLGDVAIRTGVPPVLPVQIPGHPETMSASYIDKSPSGRDLTSVIAFTAHGPYVFMELAQSVDGPDPAVAMIAKTIDLQGPAIDEFRATDPAEFADISLDPTGLLARTLPVPEEEATVVENATYEQRGALHFVGEPVMSATLFSETSMDLMALGSAVVYEAGDSEGAGRIVDAFIRSVEPMTRPANPVANLPGSRCRNLQYDAFYCLAAADKYAIEVSGSELRDVQQRAAAQYVMLMSD